MKPGPNLERQHIIHGRGAIVVVSAWVRNARKEVVQVQRHDFVIDVDVSGIGRQHLQHRPEPIRPPEQPHSITTMQPLVLPICALGMHLRAHRVY